MGQSRTTRSSIIGCSRFPSISPIIDASAVALASVDTLYDERRHRERPTLLSDTDTYVNESQKYHLRGSVKTAHPVALAS